MKKGFDTMKKAGKAVIDPADELHSRARKDPFLAALMRAIHARLRLWRLCDNKACKRAHACCGDAVACGAKRWPTARACLQQVMKARLRGPAARQLADRHVLHWRPPDPNAPKVIFRWGERDRPRV